MTCQTSTVSRLASTFESKLKAERAARAKLEEAFKAAGMTDRGKVRGDDIVKRTPLFQKVYSGQPISDERLRQLIGDAPLPTYNRDGVWYAMETGPMPNDPLGRMPIPTGMDVTLLPRLSLGFKSLNHGVNS